MELRSSIAASSRTPKATSPTATTSEGMQTSTWAKASFPSAMLDSHLSSASVLFQAFTFLTLLWPSKAQQLTSPTKQARFRMSLPSTSMPISFTRQTPRT
jgi:hypothetical protein